MKNSITRRQFLKAGTAAATVGLGSRNGLLPTLQGSEAEGQRLKRNVLFIVVDDLNHALGCYGHPVVKSPNIDKLAKRGIRFDRAYCQYPVCNPSRTSFLTGLRPDSTGVLNNTTAFRSKLPDVVTLPQLFRKNGYFTARLGKVFHGRKGTDDPKAWDTIFDPKGTELGKRGEGRNLTGGRVKWCRWLAAEGGDEDQPDGQFAAEAVRLLEQHQHSPFFLAVGFHKPHDPFVAPKQYFDLYQLEQLDPPRDPADRSAEHPQAIASGWKKEFDRFTDRERREFMRAYYACISFMDAQVGKIVAAMDHLDLWRNTTVVFFSDHGYQLGQRGWWNKNTLFELSARAPMIVATPEVSRSGTSCSRIIEFVDIYPTLTDLCRLSAPNDLAGTSFKPLLARPDIPWKKAAFTQVQRGAIAGRSVRTERWRYTEWDNGKQGAELYDHENDPGEYYNLARETEYAQTMAELRKLLQRQ
ncbi:MAG: sulfatase [Planctomycetota bacterium]